MSLDFTAIDFETANGFWGSPCAIGMVRVRNGEIADTHTMLMKPPEAVERFDPRNVAIHGIRPDMVVDAPRFKDALQDIWDFVGDDVLVAHNSAFDMGVLRSAAEVSRVDCPSRLHVCSVKISRRTYTLRSHSLPYAAEAAGFNLEHHHRADQDAMASAAIVIDAARIHGHDSLYDLVTNTGAGFRRSRTFEAGVTELSDSARKALSHIYGEQLPLQPEWATR